MNRRHFLASAAVAALAPALALRAASEGKHFTLVQRKGRWWFVTPEGKPFFSLGLNHIDPASLRYPENIHLWRDKYGGSMLRWLQESVATRARAGKLINSDVKGGTFTISNLGPFGIEQFDAIINAPEPAILAVGATQLEAIPSEDGTIRSLPVVRMTLSADHRIVDGAVAARFIADLKTILEAPILLAF